MIEGLATIPWDGIPWDFAARSSRVVVIGDMHGDFGALVSILGGLKLIAAGTGDWTGEDTTLITVGDHIGRGPHPFEVMNLMMKLEAQTSRSGAQGQVINLLGNHELLPTQGDFRYVLDRNGAFRGESPYAQWFRRRNAAIRLTMKHAHGESRLRTLLIGHALFDFSWALEREASLDRINATIRAWFAHLQGVRAAPDAQTRWVIGDDGPLWTLTMADGNGEALEIQRGTLDKVLSRYAADAIVIGHTVVPDGQIQLSHKIFGDKVIMVDTGISAHFSGTPSALEIRDGRLTARVFSRASGISCATLRELQNDGRDG